MSDRQFSEIDRDLALLDAVLGGKHNFKKAKPHTSRHGFEGYHLYFGYRYLFNHTVDRIREYGFEIDNMAMTSHLDSADFKVQVNRVREPTDNELAEIDPDHYLVPDNYEP